jgi:hypothetical protein
MKTRGANIHRSVCHAEPYPDDPTIRETFNLLRVGDGWFCELHRPAKKTRTERTVPVASVTAVDVFENLIGEQFAILGEAIDDGAETAWQALETVEEEVARGLEALKQAVAR